MSNIAIIIICGLLFVILVVAVPLFIIKSKDVSVIKSDEAVASARIIEISDTGSRYNRNPEVKLKLEVTPNGASPYQVDIKAVISFVDIPAFQPGCVIRVKYKVDKPSEVSVIGK